METISLLVTQENVDIFIKLFLGLSLGAILGLERIFAHRTAGVRTYALVSMGSTLLIIISEAISHQYLGIGFNPDPLKIASNIVVGVGFLGAGIIIFKDSKLIGLTTAAGLWVSAAIGISVGYGMYLPAFFATIFTLFIFTILWYIESGLLSLYDSHKGSEE